MPRGRPKKNKESEKDELSLKHQEFVKEYIIQHGNAKRAYMAVYTTAKETTAEVNSCTLLRNTKIKQAIEAEYKKIWKEKDTEIEQSKTYQMIHSIGNSNIADVVDLESGTLKVKDLKDIPASAQQAIHSIEMTEKSSQYGIDRNIKVKLYNKLPALELRAKIQKMITDNGFDGDIIIIPAIRPDKKKKKKEKEENE